MCRTWTTSTTRYGERGSRWVDEAGQPRVCASLENDVIYIPFDALHVGECGGHDVAHFPSRCSGQGGFLGWLGHSGFEHMLLSHKQRIWIQMEGRVRFLRVGYTDILWSNTWRGGLTRGMAKWSQRRHFRLASCLLFFKHVLCWNFHVLLFLRPTEWHPLQVQGLVMVDRGSQKLLDLLLLDHLAQLLDQSNGLCNIASRSCWEDCIDPDTSWLWIHFDLRHLPHHAHTLCGWWHLSLCFQGRECGGYMSKCLQMHGHLQQCGGVFGHLAGNSCLRQHGQHLLHWSQDRSDLQLDLCGHFHVGQVLPGSC